MLRLIVLGWFFMIALCNLSFAQSLADCSGINLTPGPKVLVDTLKYTSADNKTQILTSEYEFEFLLELRSRFQNLFSDTQPQPVLCANRDPKPDGSDFVPNLVKTLHNSDVLLEVWGTIKAGKKNGKEALGANILMIIIPIRYYEGSTAQLDFHLLSYPKTEQDDLEAASVQMAFGTEFDVYTSIAYGIKFLKNGSYDKAKKYFSRARIQWENALKKKTLATTLTDQEPILNYIKNLEKKTVTEAAADPSYRGDLIAVADALAEKRP